MCLLSQPCPAFHFILRAALPHHPAQMVVRGLPDPPAKGPAATTADNPARKRVFQRGVLKHLNGSPLSLCRRDCTGTYEAAGKRWFRPEYARRHRPLWSARLFSHSLICRWSLRRRKSCKDYSRSCFSDWPAKGKVWIGRGFSWLTS